MKDWIQSLQGRKVTPRALKVDQVGSIHEIAHALAGEYRFTRQTTLRYSVAEHCVRGSLLLPAAFAGAFLLHELSEVYLPDIAGPLKPFLFVDVPETVRGVDDGSCTRSAPWAELERQHTHTILEALGLTSIEPLIYSPEIKRMDLAMLAAEKRDLCGLEPEPWGLPEDPPAGVGVIAPWASEYASVRFLERYRELF